MLADVQPYLVLLDRTEASTPEFDCVVEDRPNPQHTYVREPSGVVRELSAGEDAG